MNNTISIHALTRSATMRWRSWTKEELISIHALTRSATQTILFQTSQKLFQSTHSRGVRLLIRRFRNEVLLDFNPRTHEECDDCQ